MKKSTLFLIVLVAIFFTSTLYLLYLNNHKPQSTSISSTGIIPTETSDPTDDWKTYTNEKYNFSFRYPSYLHQIKSTASSTSLPSEQFQSNDYKTEDTVQNTLVSQGLRLSFIYDYSSICNTDEDVTKHELNITTIDNREVRRYFISWEGMVYYAADILLPNSCLNIELKYGNNYNKNQVLDIFTQVLSTFKFTGSNVSFDSPQSVVKKYLDASIKGDLATAKIYCPDIKSTALDSYHFIDYHIISLRADKDPNYYHVYVQFTDETGKIYNKASKSDNPLEVLLYKKPDGQWKALTWYFYQ